MINVILSKFKSEDAVTVVKNFLSLFIIQIANYILPFITVPYLTRVLGAGNYGLIGFANAFMGYFIILTDYGFNLSAIKEISIRKNNKDEVSEIFWTVSIIKFVFLIASFILLCVVVLSFSKFREHAVIYLVAFGSVVGSALFPVWFFQGMEKMKYITYLNISTKFVITVLIFIIVRNENHYLNYIVLNVIGSILAGFISMWVAVNKFGIRFKVPGFSSIKKQLIEGWYIFISSVSIVLYTSSTTFILGIFTNNTIVGYFVGADKIRQALQGLFTPVFQVLYPYVSKLAHKSKEEALKFIKKEVLAFSIGAALICLTVYFNAEPIVYLLLGKQYMQSIVLLKIMSFLPLLIVLGNILTVQCMLSFGLKKDYSRIYLITSFVGFFFMIGLTYFYSSKGTAYSILLIETLVIILTFYKIRKNEIYIFN